MTSDVVSGLQNPKKRIAPTKSVRENLKQVKKIDRTMAKEHLEARARRTQLFEDAHKGPLISEYLYDDACDCYEATIDDIDMGIRTRVLNHYSIIGPRKHRPAKDIVLTELMDEYEDLEGVYVLRLDLIRGAPSAKAFFDKHPRFCDLERKIKQGQQRQHDKYHKKYPNPRVETKQKVPPDAFRWMDPIEVKEGDIKERKKVNEVHETTARRPLEFRENAARQLSERVRYLKDYAKAYQGPLMAKHINDSTCAVYDRIIEMVENDTRTWMLNHYSVETLQGLTKPDQEIAAKDLIRERKDLKKVYHIRCGWTIV
jgi:hypothetical protein